MIGTSTRADDLQIDGEDVFQSRSITVVVCGNVQRRRHDAFADAGLRMYKSKPACRVGL